MTKGEVIIINTDDTVYNSAVFNGDMYPEVNGKEIIERFGEGSFSKCQYYKRFIDQFNKRHYGYEDELYKLHTYNSRTIPIKDNYTDYLYIINESNKEWVIIDEHDNSVFLSSRSLAIVYFKEVEKIYHRVDRDTLNPKHEYVDANEFKDIINRLKESSDLVDKVDELFRNSRENIECDFCNGASLQISHESIVVKLLEKMFNDIGEWISYFIYELDYGRKYEHGMITEEDGEIIDLSSPQKLYDFLVIENNKR